MESKKPVPHASTPVKKFQRLLITLFLLRYSLFTKSDATENYTSILVENGMPNLTIISVERQYVAGTPVKNMTEEVEVENRFRPPRRKNEDQKRRKRSSPIYEWTKISVKYYQKRSNTILGKIADRFTLKCTAPYLTRWTSNIVPRRLFSKYWHANRYHDPLQLQGPNITFESKIVFMLPNGTSGYIQCENVANASVSTRVYIYSQDGHPLSSVNPHRKYEPVLVTDTRKTFTVPCTANYPNVSVSLVNILNFKSESEQQENVSESELDGPYDPQVGFHVRGNGKLEQRLRCQVVNFTFKRKEARSLNLTYNVYNPYLNQTDLINPIQFFIGSQNDTFSQGIWCKIQDVPNRIRMISCNSQYECDWFNDCFFNKCDGTQILPKYPNTTNIIETPFPTGKVICEPTMDFAVIAYDYLFTGLDLQQYWLKVQTNEIPKQAFIRISISEAEPDLYSYRLTRVACEITNFVLFPNIRYATIFKNGTKLLLEAEDETNIPIQIFTNNNLGFSRREIVVNVTTDVVGIVCMAPWLNSSEWINTSWIFEVKGQGLGTFRIFAIFTTFSVLSVGILVSIHMYLRANRKDKYLTNEEVDYYINGDSNNGDKHEEDTITTNIKIPDLQNVFQGADEILTDDKIQKMPLKHTIPKPYLKMTPVLLGEGEFGKVIRASLNGEDVAAKTTKPGADRECFKTLLSEIKVMQYLGRWLHPNVVQFKGAVVKDIKKLEAFAVMELSHHGNLENYLKKHSHAFINLLKEGTVSLGERKYDQIKKGISTLNLVNWCEQIACAMDFLSSKKVVHIDLAARNVLLFENDIVKISDFGLSRKLYSNATYTKRMHSVNLPLHWMAPESLDKYVFSPQSDVWSFGVTVWEIFSLCQNNVFIANDFESASKFLKEQKPFCKPTFAPESVYDKLLECWQLKPEERPSFSALQSFFKSTLKSMKDMLEAEAEIELNQDATLPVIAEFEWNQDANLPVIAEFEWNQDANLPVLAEFESNQDATLPVTAEFESKSPTQDCVKPYVMYKMQLTYVNENKIK